VGCVVVGDRGEKGDDVVRALGDQARRHRLRAGGPARAGRQHDQRHRMPGHPQGVHQGPGRDLGRRAVLVLQLHRRGRPVCVQVQHVVRVIGKRLPDGRQRGHLQDTHLGAGVPGHAGDGVQQRLHRRLRVERLVAGLRLVRGRDGREDLQRSRQRQPDLRPHRRLGARTGGQPPGHVDGGKQGEGPRFGARARREADQLDRQCQRRSRCLQDEPGLLAGAQLVQQVTDQPLAGLVHKSPGQLAAGHGHPFRCHWRGQRQLGPHPRHLGW